LTIGDRWLDCGFGIGDCGLAADAVRLRIGDCASALVDSAEPEAACIAQQAPLPGPMVVALSMEMTPASFRARTKALAVRVARMVDALPPSRSTDVITRQLLRCATGVGANYRAACRAKSPRDFVCKMAIVEEECDECLYWLELLIETKKVREERLADLLREANEILAMVVASIRTARRRAQMERCLPQAAGHSPIRNPQSPMPNPQSPIRNPQSPIPNPQSPIPNPQSPIRNPGKESPCAHSRP
jgi:four helix bundle protein